MIVVTGSLAYDHILDFPGRFKEHILPQKIHVLSLSFLAQRMRKMFGGTGGNIAYSLALLGESPVLFSTAGESDFAEYGDCLKACGVETQWVRLVDKPTATFFGIIDQDDNQIGGFYPGAMEDTVRLSLHNLPKEDIELVIIAPNEPTAMVNFAEECRQLNLRYIFDPGQQIPRLSKEELVQAIRGAEVFMGNDYEVSLVSEKMGCPAEEMVNLCPMVIKTLGRYGSEIFSGGHRHKIPVVEPTEVIDPTGAGDAYRAGIIKGLVRGWPEEEMGRAASLSAVYAVENYGAQEHKYTPEEYVKRYQDCFGDHIKL